MREESNEIHDLIEAIITVTVKLGENSKNRDEIHIKAVQKIGIFQHLAAFFAHVELFFDIRPCRAGLLFSGETHAVLGKGMKNRKTGVSAEGEIETRHR